MTFLTPYYLKNLLKGSHQVLLLLAMLVSPNSPNTALIHSCRCCQAHLNLNAEYLPYKHIIGQVILDVCGTTSYPFLNHSLMPNSAEKLPNQDSGEQIGFHP